MANETQVSEALAVPGTERWPIEVRALVASLRVRTGYRENDRRRETRRRYEIQTTLWFKDDASRVQNTTVYTRDLLERMMSFVCSSFFKVGQVANLDIPDASGAMHRVQGHIRRCRQVRDGWFDCLFELQKGAKVER
jgi:hypothetical protein